MTNVLKKTLGMRERRKIYEDAICIVSQVNRMNEVVVDPSAQKSMQKTLSNQLSKAMTIVVTTLGYHESAAQENEKVLKIFLPEDNNAEYGICKEKMEMILTQLPTNKEMKETLWKACVKRDKKSTERFKALVA